MLPEKEFFCFSLGVVVSKGLFPTKRGFPFWGDYFLLAFTNLFELSCTEEYQVVIFIKN